MESPPEVEDQAVAENPALTRRARFWAWPAILLAPVLMLLSERLVPEAETEAEVQHDTSLLALLQVQSKLIIAAATSSQEEARKQLVQLEAYATTDGNAAALALVHGFIGLGDGGQEAAELLLARQGERQGADEAFLEEVRAAVVNGVDETQRERLAERVGWFSKLAGTPGEPGKAPEGGAIRSGAMGQAVLVMGIFAAGLIAIFLGAAVLLLAVFLRAGEKLKFAFDRDRPPAGVLLEVFAIFLLGMAIGNIAGWLIHWTLQPVISLGGLFVAMFWPKWQGVPWAESRRALGLHRGQGLFRELGAGVVGYLTLLPMALIGLTMTGILMAVVKLAQQSGESAGSGAGELFSEPVTHPAAGWMLGGWEAKIAVFFLAAVLAPVVEELFFRGAFYRNLRVRFPLIGAGLISGLIFAVLHPQGWMGIPALMMMGFGFACIREWRDSLIAPMTAHAINNGLLIGGLALLLA